MNKKKVKQKVLETLRKYYNSGKEISLPVPIKAIAKSYNIRVIPYSRHMKTFKLTLEELYIHAGTKDAYTDFDACSKSYIIIYNDMDYNINVTNRYRWNIAHELGHILLEHHKNTRTRILNNELNQNEYINLEREADWFAAYILVPHAVLYNFNKSISADSIKWYCKISTEAAINRKKDFNRWRINNSFFNNYDLELLKIFSHQRICKTCKCLVYDDYIYCPICGKKGNFKTHYKSSIKKDIKIMKYKSFTNEYGAINICPLCQNEEIVKNAKYCHICGSSFVNKCLFSDEQCEEAKLNPIPSNARYCPYCGSETTFKRFLPKWQEEQKQKQEIVKEAFIF